MRWSNSRAYPEGRGPVFPKSYSRVVFRINGEKELREFNGKMQSIKHPYPDIKPHQWCDDFVDLRCKPFMISPDCSKTWRFVGKPEVDMYYFDHPEVKL